MAKEHFELTVVDPGSLTLTGALGISEKRKKALIDLLHKESPKHERVSTLLNRIFTKCESFEEVVFVTYAFGQAVGHGISELMGLFGMIASIAKKKGFHKESPFNDEPSDN